MKKILLTGYLVCQLLHGIGQSDSLLYTQSLNQAVETFQSARQEQLPIYTGISYYGYVNTKGTPMFMELDYRIGSLSFEGNTYHQVPMMYELVQDVLVVKPPHDYRGIILFTPRVNWFRFDNYNFVHLDSLRFSNLPGNGFYQELVTGKITLYSRITKTLEEKLDGMTLIRSFVQRKFLYAVKDDSLYRITNQASLMDLLRDHKKEVSGFIRSNKIKFRKSRELASLQIVRYYNQLKP